MCGVGMAMGRGRVEGWGLRPRPAGLVLPHPCLGPHDGDNFLIPSLPLGASRSTAPPHKLYYLLICPTTITIFLIKLVSLIKKKYT